MTVLLTFQLDIVSQTMGTNSTFLASGRPVPHRGTALLSRINYNNGDEVHKSSTSSSNASPMLMKGNQL